jgi:hypothetical protein
MARPGLAKTNAGRSPALKTLTRHNCLDTALPIMPSWDFSQAYRKQLDLFKRNRESKVMIQFRDVAPDALLRGGARSAL